MPFLVVGVDSCHLNSPVFSTQGKQMWDQIQRRAGREKVCMAVYEEKCFCVLTSESKGYFALQLCVSGERIPLSCKASVGEAHDGSAKTPLCPG